MVTTTCWAPASPAGVIQVIDLLLTKVVERHVVPPIVTVAPRAKLVPAMLTAVDPVVGPKLGEIAVTLGAEIAAL